MTKRFLLPISFLLLILNCSPVSVNNDESAVSKAINGNLPNKGIKTSARSQDAIGIVIGKHSEDLEYCYKKERRINPHLRGSVTVQFVISPDGEVSTVQIKNSTLKNRTVENCIMQNIKAWSFGEVNKAIGNVTTEYKWIFN